VAKRVLEERSKVTGIKVPGKVELDDKGMPKDRNLAAEVQRLQKLNEGQDLSGDITGKQIKTYNQESLASLSKGELLFANTPLAGEFFKLKNPNLTDRDIQHALDMQKQNPKMLIGQILQDPELMKGYNLSTAEQVKSGLDAQNAWKDTL